MLRVSKYNIYIQMNNDNNNHLAIQGVHGSFDIIENQYIELLKKAQINHELINNFPDDIKKGLIDRGYITSLSEDEEFLFIQKLCSAMNKKNRENINITILPTYNCNFRCEYCFERNLQQNGVDWLNKKMSTDIVDAIFSQINKYMENNMNVTGICLFGGEPLLRTNYEIVNYICSKANELSLPITCISNGYDLDKYIDLVKEYGFKHIQITLDGIGTEHDKRRFLTGGQGTYETIINNIDLALNNDINIVLRTNVNTKNIESIDKLTKLYDEKGWTKNKHFSYYFKTTMKCYDKPNESLSEIELMKKLSKMYNADISKFSFNSIYNSLYQGLSSMLKNNSYAPFKSGYCGANGGMYTIDPNGDIYPCWDVLSNEKCKIGKVDLASGTFVFNDTYENWKGRTVEKVSNCKDCPYMLFCGGGCAAQSLVLYNDMNIGYCDDFIKIFEEVAIEVCEHYVNTSNPSNNNE